MKIMAATRISHKSNMEKVTHYKRRLNQIKNRLLKVDAERAPLTTQRLIRLAIWMEKRIMTLQNNHRH